MPSRLRQAYDRLIASGRLKPDPSQQGALATLDRVGRDLSRGRGLFGGRRPVRGAYLWGPPGRGKSLLADLFCSTVAESQKRRVHFHAFMAEIHDQVRIWRAGDPAERRARFGQARGDDPIRPIAEAVARQTRLLCLDEFQVTDIADAMILGRLFEVLWDKGVVLVTTSNRAPDDLYADGINRQLFMPFIAELKRACEVVALAGPMDWRLERLKGRPVYFTPLDGAGRAGFEALWSDLKGEATEAPARLEVAGRSWTVERTAGALARASFDALCDRPLGPQDYLALAARFDTLFLEAVPVLAPERREAARRFVTLIDALYEARTRLVVLAEAEPDQLYREGLGSFEFERLASRLQEMRSAGWFEAR